MPVQLLDEEALFHAARRITDPAARELFLNQACGDDAALAQRVRTLLELHEQEPESFAAPKRTIAFEPAVEGPGARVGPYLLREKIGEGGFGLVFVAEQQEPVKRKVALKVIKPGMDSNQVIARFEAERQALALMDHPNIARVLDVGATESGRPYFVMELVRGIPITDYCDQNQLSPRERLDLFVTVCHAIQHAHQKGVIHRDIKPSNVLVTSHDGKPVAKVIDFGVAKAIHQQLTERTIYTQFAQMIGTPLYMSPEQAEMSGLDIDTRSDVYSLGVLLYELLTGTTPLEKTRFAKAAYDEIRRVIREEEPPKPSLRLSTSESLPSIAASRHTEPTKLSNLIRGDLDWITMKALEKDRTRRYETANGLARDIQRHLADEIVEARAPSTSYRLRKFAKKNRAAITTAAAISLLLVFGVVGTTYGLIRANRSAEAARHALFEAEEQKENALRAAEREAEQRQKAEKARSEAQAKEAEANAVVWFFENKVFAAGRPKGQEGGLGHDVSLHDAIRAALSGLGSSFARQPLVEARLRRTLGSTFHFLGDYARSAEQYERARALLTRARGPEHPDTLRSMGDLALSYADMSRHEEAAKLGEETLAARKRVLPPDHPEILLSLNNLAVSYNALNRHAEALKLQEEVAAAYKRLLPPDHMDVLRSMSNLAVSYMTLDRYAEAVKLNEDVLAARKRILPPDHPETLDSMNNLAICYGALNRHVEKLRLCEETLAAQKRVLPPDHPFTLTGMNNLAASYDALGRHAEALKMLEETLAARKRVLPPDHSDTLVSMRNLAACYTALNRHAEALKLNEETLAGCKRALPPDHPETLRSMNNLALNLEAFDRRAEALKLREETLAARKRVLPPDHSDTLRGMLHLARSYATAKRHAEARKLLEETLAAQRRALPPGHPDTLATMSHLAYSLAELGRDAEALALREETLALRKRSLPPDHPKTLSSMYDLANSYTNTNRHAEARALNEETLAARKRVLPPDHPDTLRSMFSLAKSYSAANRHTEALKLHEETLAARKRVLPPDHQDTLLSKYNVARSYCALNRHAEAISLIDDLLSKTGAAALSQRHLETVVYWRMQHFQKSGDLAGCRATVEMQERLAPNALNLYNCACMRAVIASLEAKTKKPDAAKIAKEEADKAMAWLNKAVAAGWKNAEQTKKDADLDFLRDREDFKKLLAELEAKVPPKKP